MLWPFTGKKDTKSAQLSDSPAQESAAPPVSCDTDDAPLERPSAPTPESLAVDMQQQNLLDSTDTNLRQPEIVSRGNKRRKDIDDMSTTSPAENKRRKSPEFDSSSRDPPYAHMVQHLDAKSSVAAAPPPDPDPPPPSDAERMEYAGLPEGAGEDDKDSQPPQLVRDLESRSITTAALIQEVRGIYAGLAMVEKKCIEIVDGQLKSQNKLTKEQWQALIALHRTLLNEHHDFFSASHHPVTRGHELRELAARYAMPARMWRHGIHAFLELLRHKLPDSLEHMVSFLYLSYSMMALLKETVPEFIETWIECLGDLARYRMAIEEADLRDREVWSNTARTWYNQAADLSPNTGRIQHHLAVLARPYIVQQLFLYSKALVAAIPFKNAADSILLLFNPLTDPNSRSLTRHAQADFTFVCAAAVLFRRQGINDFFAYEKGFTQSFPSHLGTTGSKFKIQGPEYAGSLFAMLMDFGKEDNTLWNMIFDHSQELRRIYCERNNQDPDKLPKDFTVQDTAIIDPPRTEYWSQKDLPAIRVPPTPALRTDLTPDTPFSSDDVSSYAGPMLFRVITDVADQIGNKNVVPFMHMVLAYLYGLTWIPGASVYVEACIPWQSVVKFLNTVGRSGVSYENVEGKEFPKSYGGSKRQLIEDFVMRGLMVMTYYYNADFFQKEDLLDEDERLLEQPSHHTPRVERCLWAAHKLAILNDRWLSYDSTTKQFSATDFARTLLQQRKALTLR